MAVGNSPYHLKLISNYINFLPQVNDILIASLGISVVTSRIWWCERGVARSHHQIRGPTTPSPRDPPYFSFLF
jgi:hypothetical protein